MTQNRVGERLVPLLSFEEKVVLVPGEFSFLGDKAAQNESFESMRTHLSLHFITPTETYKFLLFSPQPSCSDSRRMNQNTFVWSDLTNVEKHDFL